VPPLSHLHSCTLTKSNLCLANSMAAPVSEPALYTLLTSQVKNLMSIFRCLGRTKVSVQVRGFLYQNFIARYFLQWGVVSTSPHPQAVGPNLLRCPWRLIKYIRSCYQYWRPFHHPQAEDAPCCADRDPLITRLIVKVKPVTGLEWPRGFLEVKVPRFHDNGTGWW